VVPLIALVLIGLLIFGIVRRTSLAPAPKSGPNLPPLPRVPKGGADHGVETTYVTTTVAGDHTQRVIARGLGKRCSAIAAVRTDGVLIDRRGAPTLFIPTHQLDGVRRTESLVVIRWSHGAERLETGLRMRNATERDRLADRISGLTDSRGSL
jgi:hypothetical protein